MNGRSRALDLHLQALDRGSAEGLHPRQDLRRLHPRPRRPGGVVDRDHEGRARPRAEAGHGRPGRPRPPRPSGRRRPPWWPARRAPPSLCSSRGMVSPDAFAGLPRAAPARPLTGARSVSTGTTRATAIPSGSGDAVVRIAWPAGSSVTSARLRTGSSSENTSSSRRVGATGVRARTRSWIPSRRARARQRCSPCDAWVRASRPSSTITEVVAMRAHRVDAAPQIVASARPPARRGGRRPSCVDSAVRPWRRRRRRRAGCRRDPRAASSSATSRSRAATSTLPASANRWSHTSSVVVTSAPARPPDWRNNAARWRSTRSVSSAARAPSVSSRASVSSRRSRRPRGPPLINARSSGEKIVHGAAAASTLRPFASFRFTRVRLRPAGSDLRLHRDGALRRVEGRPHDGVSAPVRTIASGGAPRNERRVPR